MLARSTKQLCEIIDIIKEKELRLAIIESITLDCRGGQVDPMSEAYLQMTGVFSQLDLAIIRRRVKSGILNLSKLARGCDLSKTTVYKYISLLEIENNK